MIHTLTNPRVRRFGLNASLMALALVLPMSVHAQNPSAQPTYGAVSLRSGFLPDPFVRNVTAGGAIRTNLGGVNAFVAANPDFRLHYQAGGLPLTIRVESQADTTLLINLPNGQWIANDDGGAGLNPAITFTVPMSGQFDIFVGTYGPNPAPARLIITELGQSNGPIVQPPVTQPPVAQQPIPSLNPTYGTFNLVAGFLPDPVVRNVTAGGSIRTNLGGVSANVAQAPDLRLNYQAGGRRLTIRVESQADTTLLINIPNGQWIAIDDARGSLNPAFTFDAPMSGQYDVFVGTFGQNPVPARVIVTERE